MKGKGTEKETKKQRKKERKKERKKDRKKERRRKRKSKGRNRKKEKKGRGKGEERERKGKGKRKERERKRGKGSVSHGAFLMSKVIVLLSFMTPVSVPFFGGNGYNHQKRSVATAYQAPSLCRICAITTTNNERKIPNALNSRRMMEKSRTLDFKSLDTDH